MQLQVVTCKRVFARLLTQRIPVRVQGRKGGVPMRPIGRATLRDGTSGLTKTARAPIRISRLLVCALNSPSPHACSTLPMCGCHIPCKQHQQQQPRALVEPILARSVSRPRRSILTAAAGLADSPATSQDTLKYRSLTKQGNMTSVVAVHRGNEGATVAVMLDGYEPDSSFEVAPTLHWGLYRASAKAWYHPRETVPHGSKLDAETGGMRTSMRWDAQQRVWMVQLNIPANLLPLHLAYVFYFPDEGLYETPMHGMHFTASVGMSAGDASSMGATVVSAAPPGANAHDAICNVNFAVFSRHASAMYLSLVRVNPGNPNLQGVSVMEIELDPVTNRTGDIWHVCIHGLRNIGLLCYGWRADGDATWESGGRYHPGFILADPYATRVVPVLLPEAAYKAAPKLLPKYDLKQPVLLSSLASFTQSFQWGGAHRPVGRDGNIVHHSLESQVLLELDIERFTQTAEADRAVPAEHRGKFLGVLDRIKEITDAGVTSVLLSPCCCTGPGVGPWGRNPTQLMAPNPQYAVHGPLAAADELKTLIQVLHRSGIEVLLSVEYCLTCEGKGEVANGGLQGMRGLDASIYYRPVTGSDSDSVLAAGHPIVRPLVLESLRHWATEYCVDGFCFVHAENLAQDQFGSILDNPPLAEEICHDPVLRGLKLLAVPGDTSLLPRGGVRGFPHWGIWQQTNGKYMSHLWSYLVENQPGLLSGLATAITGSADLLAPQWDTGLPGALAAGRRAAFGVNCITPVGDAPLLTALGGDDNLERAEVMARTLLLAQFTSAGTPIVAASTFSRKGLWRFVAMLSALRRQLQALINPPITFMPPPETAAMSPPRREITWLPAVAGMIMGCLQYLNAGSEVDWQNMSQGAYPSNMIAYWLRDATSGTSLYVALNPYDQQVLVSLPALGGGTWRLVVDTAQMPPKDIDLQGPMLPPGTVSYQVAPKAGILLVGVQTAPTRAQPQLQYGQQPYGQQYGR